MPTKNTMSHKTLYIIITVLLVVIVAGLVYVMSNKSGTKVETGNQPATSSPEQTGSISTPLAEQPNQIKFDEYFTEIYLLKAPAGEKASPFNMVRTTVFTSKDQFCTGMSLKKTIPSGNYSVAIYDVNAKIDVQPKTVFPMELKQGDFGGCGNLNQVAGSYEQKIYVDDVLVAVLPFEVK